MRFTSETLRKAWALARSAQTEEVSARRLFGWALKEVRSMEESKPVTRSVDHLDNKYRRGYGARITGVGGQYGLIREFLPAARDGNWMTFEVTLDEGAAYEFSGDKRNFYVVEGGKLVPCERSYLERTLA